jgi:diacylglycerol O-acyltransferase / wax synthase
MARMRAMEAAFLAMERPHEPRHVGVMMIFGASGDGPLSVEVVRQVLRERLAGMPSTGRVVVDAPLGLSRPSWRDVTPDLDVHVRRHRVSAGGGDEELARIIAEVHAVRLDRRRPLWELHIVDGLEGGRVALYAKVHAAALDDTTGVDLMTGLLDDDRRGASEDHPISPARPVGGRAPDPADVYERFIAPVPDQLRQAAGFPGRLAGRAARAVGEQLPGLADTAAEMVRRTPGMGALARLLPAGDEDTGDGDEHPTGRAPRLSFNAPISSARSFAASSLATVDVLRVKEHAGASFNEVVVAVCAGALRRWLLANDELPTSPVVAIVPVLVADSSGAGSHIAGIMLALPTNVADPLERLTRVGRALSAARRSQATAPASLQQDVAMFAPPLVAAGVTRLLDALPHRPFVSPTVNLAVTNVPGPRRPVHLAGRPLISGHPVLSVTDLTPLHVGVQAGPDRVGIGVIACRDHVEDLHSLAFAAPIELAELVGAVRPRPRRAAHRTGRDPA